MPVPSGNFTGSMLIGGRRAEPKLTGMQRKDSRTVPHLAVRLVGRMMGALVRDYGPGMAVSRPETALQHVQIQCCACRSGVYAMVGSASMLAGFKQMAVAVVVFITGPRSQIRLGPALGRQALTRSSQRPWADPSPNAGSTRLTLCPAFGS